jgi:polysaccharide pyruvyl transferase WcaK-like protein
VKRRVVWRDTYWRPDEAGSVYARALAVVSFEMHSPIIAAAMGTPAFHLRQPTDTSKGQMWRDIGLQDWIFEIDQAAGGAIADRLLGLHSDYPAAQARLKTAMNLVARRQEATMAVVDKATRSE